MPSAGGDIDRPPPLLPSAPSHLLEVTIVSAQDLHPAVKSPMRTYAVAWIDSTHKLRTTVDTVDTAGHADPAWNDKLAFRLDSGTLNSDTASINIDIFAARPRFHPGSDIVLGTARALISTLSPTMSAKFVALQVRRPSSLRPQGILNIGVALANVYGKSMPLVGGKSDLAVDKGKVERSRSVDKGRFERSRSVTEMERKLERWRVELPTLKHERESIDEKEKGERPRIGRGRSRRTAGRLTWLGTDREGKGRGEENKLER